MNRLLYLLSALLCLGIFAVCFSLEEANAQFFRRPKPSSRPFPQPTSNPAPTPTPTPTAAPNPGVNLTNPSIKGVVDRCIPGEIEGSEVYIEGKSYFVRTGSGGEFNFYLVPSGSHRLVFDLPGLAPYKMNLNLGTQPINLGNVNVCPDGDEDGFVVDEDCDDTVSSVYPGAPEVCNFRDDDCDGVNDEDLNPPAGQASIEIVSPLDGTFTTNINSFDLQMGDHCTLDFLGAPNEYQIIAVPQVPHGYAFKVAMILQKPDGDEEIVLGQNLNNPSEFSNNHLCTPLCEGGCCPLYGMSGGGYEDVYFNQLGTYTVTVLVLGMDNTILAQDYITLVRPEIE